ncbi:hypothetical protein ACH5RR_035841 [Cinchona calisaya]|uniref:PPIase cyclophilin-type domain-containing protein n=1 Tax=Cinchona calisaya TaxID=153742 RepID=A0ABD2Y672_9GENT
MGRCKRVLESISLLAFYVCLLLFWAFKGTFATEPQMGSVRVVFQTNYGDIEFGFYPTVAPRTVEHVFKLVQLGCYNTTHFFRVDKGFVAQVADVIGGRSAPMNEEQRVEAEKTIIGEFSDLKHVRGILSMGRSSGFNSAQSSFSIILGDAPFLDAQYAIFGKVTKGDETLRKLEQLPTRTEGIFVMPTERIAILSSYYYDTEMETRGQDWSILKRSHAAPVIESQVGVVVFIFLFLAFYVAWFPKLCQRWKDEAILSWRIRKLTLEKVINLIRFEDNLLKNGGKYEALSGRSGS